MTMQENIVPFPANLTHSPIDTAGSKHQNANNVIVFDHWRKLSGMKQKTVAMLIVGSSTIETDDAA